MYYIKERQYLIDISDIFKYYFFGKIKVFFSFSMEKNITKE